MAILEKNVTTFYPYQLRMVLRQESVFVNLWFSFVNKYNTAILKIIHKN